MIAKHLLTSVFVILAFGVADSFAAASIRAGTVGASGASGTSARAGSLRVGSGASLSTKATTTSSNTATTSTDSSRMPALPMGAPKVTTKPKLPSYSGGTVVSGDVDLSDVYNRIDTVEDKAEAAQSAAETAGTVASNAQSAAETAGATANAAQTTAENAANAVAGKLDKPTGGGVNQVLKLNADGTVRWDTDSMANVQLAAFSNQLYYCGKTNGGTCNTSNQSDGWENSGLSAVSGADGKTAWLRKVDDGIQVCYKTNKEECANADYTTIVPLSAIKGADGSQGQPGTPGANGATPWLRKGSTHIEACYKANQSDCTNADYAQNQLVPLSEIKGAPGETGQSGAAACNGDIKIGSGTPVTGGVQYELYCDENE